MPVERPRRGGSERLVELFDRGRAADGGREVDDADGRCRDAQAEAVELALEVRDDEGEGLRRAGRGRDDVLAGAPGAARVLVRDVEDALVVGVAVDGVHQPLLDGDQVVDDLGRRREAVRRAAGVADDVMRRRVVAVLVDAEDDRDVLVLRGRADDDLLGAGGRYARLAFSASVKMPVHSSTMSTPRSPQGRFAGSFSARILISRPSMMIDESSAVDVARIGAVGRVVLEQQGVHLRVDEVVDGDDLDVGGPLDEGLERLAADATEAVDADAGGHSENLLLGLAIRWAARGLPGHRIVRSIRAGGQDHRSRSWGPDGR